MARVKNGDTYSCITSIEWRIFDDMGRFFVLKKVTSSNLDWKTEL